MSIRSNCLSWGVVVLKLPLSFFLSFLCRVPCRRYDRIWVSFEITISLVVRVVWAWKTGYNKQPRSPTTQEFCQLQFGTRSNPLRQYLHAGAVGFTADQSCGDVGVSELIIQVDYVGHPAREEELVPLDLAGAEQHAVDVPTCGVILESGGILWHSEKRRFTRFKWGITLLHRG